VRHTINTVQHSCNLAATHLQHTCQNRCNKVSRFAGPSLKRRRFVRHSSAHCNMSTTHLQHSYNTLAKKLQKKSRDLPVTEKVTIRQTYYYTLQRTYNTPTTQPEHTCKEYCKKSLEICRSVAEKVTNHETHYYTLQHTATQLQHSCNTPTTHESRDTLLHTATHCNIATTQLQHTYNTRITRHTTTHCNTLQQTYNAKKVTNHETHY